MYSKEILSVLAGLIMFYSFIPYARDILKGRVRPARSTRLMMVLLLCIALLQQHSLHSGWLIAMTVGDGIGALAILALSFRRGVGGLTRLDVICYGLLALDVILWVSTGDALLALHLSILADLIAMTPVLVKTWHQPWTETPLFFILGATGPLINIIAAGRFTYAVLLFPAYIALVNFVETLLIFWRQKILPPPKGHPKVDYQPLS